MGDITPRNIYFLGLKFPARASYWKAIKSSMLTSNCSTFTYPRMWGCFLLRKLGSWNDFMLLLPSVFCCCFFLESQVISFAASIPNSTWIWHTFYYLVSLKLEEEMLYLEIKMDQKKHCIKSPAWSNPENFNQKKCFLCLSYCQ